MDDITEERQCERTTMRWNDHVTERQEYENAGGENARGRESQNPRGREEDERTRIREDDKRTRMQENEEN